MVKDLRKSYGTVQAVNGISFEVHQGEVFGLLGPNGAGKTTTVEIIESLRQPTSGHINVCGFNPVSQADEVKTRIGVSMQATALPDKLKVHEALTLFASFYPRRANLDELLEMVSLQEKANSFYDALSGGQKQRLVIALALVNNPEVVILDEPTASLDPQSRRELHGVIERLKQQGKTIILTTHYIEEAERLCDRVAIIDHGKIIALESPRQLIAGSRGQSHIEFHTSHPIEVGTLRRIPFVESITETHGMYQLRTSHASRALIELIKLIEAENCELLDLHVNRPTLEDVFIELTGRRIRQ